MKYNFSLIKNRKVGFHFSLQNGKEISFSNTITNIKQNKKSIIFSFEKYDLEIIQEKFEHMIVRKTNDTIWIIEDNDCTISPFIGFTMFDTYGFPIELTQEMFEEKGYKLDTKSCEILTQLQKDMSKNTFKSKNAFEK